MATDTGLTTITQTVRASAKFFKICSCWFVVVETFNSLVLR